MFIDSLKLLNFRNYSQTDLSFDKKGALLFGENGAGKTNILEAIYFLCMGRSQRGASRKEMIQRDSNEFFINGEFYNSTKDTTENLSIGYGKNKKLVMKKNGTDVQLLSELFLNNKIVSFSTQDSFLIYGDPAERRKYMDIILCQTDSEYLKCLIQYKKNLINRNKLLTINSSDPSIEIYEEKMAKYGSFIFHQRMKLFEFILPLFTTYYSKISPNSDIGTIRYIPSIPNKSACKDTWSTLFLSALKERRQKDSILGFTTTGPHRDDFKSYLNDTLVKSFGSQGQCRSMAISLRLCALDYLDKHRVGNTIVLVDDAFSELDHTREENVYTLLENRGQLFITTLTKENPLSKNLPCFSIKDNQIIPE